MRRVLVTLLASLGVAGVLPGGASAAVFCVPTTAIAADCEAGRDSGDLQTAIDDAIALPGADTVKVGATAPGAPRPGFAATGSGGLTTVVGAGLGQTVISGSGAAPVVAAYGALEIRDLSIVRSSGTGEVVNAQGARFVNVRIAREGGAGDVLVYNAAPADGAPGLSKVEIAASAGAGYALYGFNTTFEDLTVQTDAGGYGLFVGDSVLRRLRLRTGAALAGVYATGDSVVEDSMVTVTNSGADGIYAINSGADSTVSVRDSTVVSLAAGPTGSGVVAAAFNAGKRTTVNVSGLAVAGFPLAACAGTGAGDTGSVPPGPSPFATLTMSYSAAGAVAPAACPVPGTSGYVNPPGSLTLVAGSGNLNAAPQFVNASAGDYAPLPGGNLVDAGDPEPLPSGASTVDLLGAPRVTDGNGDRVQRRDIGAYEAAAVAPTPSPSSPSNPKVVSVTFKGSLKRASVTRKAALTVLPSAPTGSKPFFTVRLDSAPSTITVRLAQRGKSGKYKTLKSAVTLTANSTTLLLRPTGSWNRKRLARGTYKLSASTPDGTAKSVTFKVK